MAPGPVEVVDDRNEQYNASREREEDRDRVHALAPPEEFLCVLLAAQRVVGASKTSREYPPREGRVLEIVKPVDRKTNEPQGRNHFSVA